MSVPMIYIISPYTSHASGAATRAIEQENRARWASRYAATLIAAGIHCWSPIAHGYAVVQAAGDDIPFDDTFDAWRDLCLAWIDLSSACHVLMLPGWTESAGARCEIAHAIRRNIPITNILPNETVMENR